MAAIDVVDGSPNHSVVSADESEREAKLPDHVMALRAAFGAMLFPRRVLESGKGTIPAVMNVWFRPLAKASIGDGPPRALEIPRVNLRLC